MISNKKSLLALSVASALALSGCFSDDDNNVVITPPPEPTDPVVVIQPPEDLVTDQPAKIFSASVQDVSSDEVLGNVLDGATISFYVNGELSTSVTDVEGETITMATVDDTGNVSFLTAEGAPAQITAVVSKDGYVTRSFVIDTTEEPGEDESDIELEFGLISKSGAGVVEKVASATVTGATTTDPIKANTDDSGAGAEANVPAGTTLLDANGDEISGGEVSLSVIAPEGQSANTGALVPPGLNDGAGSTIAVPVGVASINMSTEDGTKIKQFSNPIQASVTLSSDSGVAINDELDLASYNEDAGVWKSETNKATVTSMNTDGSYKASFMTDHLTFFAVNKYLPFCDRDIKVVLDTGSESVPARGLAVSLRSTDASATAYIQQNQSSRVIVKQAISARYGISKDATAVVHVYDHSGKTWYKSSTEVPICQSDISVQLQAPTTYVNKTLTLQGTCEQDGQTPVNLSGSVVVYGQKNKASSLAKSSGDSQFSLTGLAAGSEHKVRVTVRGARIAGGAQSTSFEFTPTADSANLTQPVSIACREVPVTGS